MSIPVIIRIKKGDGKASSYSSLLLYVSLIILFFSHPAKASYVKIYHSGSTKESQSNTFSGSYSPSTPNDSFESSPWEINASGGQALSGIDATQVTTTSIELGSSYRSEKNFGLSASVTREAANFNGVTSFRSSIGLEKTWVPGAADEDPDEDSDTSEFHSRYGISVTGSVKNALQKKARLAPKDFSVEQKVFDYGLNLQPFRWIALDFTRSRFSYDQSIEAADAVSSSVFFTDQFGYSYSNLIQGFNDQEDAIRIAFKFTPETSLEISQVKSHSIVLKKWTTDFVCNFNSTFFESFGYTVGVTQSNSFDGTSPTYSGEGSLSYYF